MSNALADPAEQGESWLNKLGIYRNKLTFLKRWRGMKESTIEVKRDLHSFTRTCLQESQRPTGLTEDMGGEGQAYIPYNLAKLYIFKVVEDMQRMKIKHMEVVREIEGSGRYSQEQAIEICRDHYRNKMKIIRLKLDAYHDLMDKKIIQFENTIKDLEKENKHLIQEKESLNLRINQLKEQMKNEKCNNVVLAFGCFGAHAIYHYLDDILIVGDDRDTLASQAITSIQFLQAHGWKINSKKSHIHPTQSMVYLGAHFNTLMDTVQLSQILKENSKSLIQMTEQERGYSTLEKVKKLMHDKENNIAEIVCEKADLYVTSKSEITLCKLLKAVTEKANLLYTEVQGVEPFVKKLLLKNHMERDQCKKLINKIKDDKLSHDTIFDTELLDYEREHNAVQFCKNLLHAKDAMENADIEKAALECIQMGTVPHWVFKHSYISLSTENLHNMKKKKTAEKIKKTGTAAAGVSKISTTHSLSHITKLRLISPLTSTPGTSVAVAPSHPSTHQRTYASAAPARSQQQQSGRTVAAIAVSLTGSPTRSECSEHSDHRGFFPASGAECKTNCEWLNIKVAQSLTYKSDRDGVNKGGGIRSRSPSGPSALWPSLSEEGH
ncbi:Hypothetical predicted protein [Pelobates cultripes]|uniref:Uncharacterized protein n=1 Tax=Pelobates cultripes TaxID=61616 RepID=A0AAD1W574_PELCU|nr:Hypothetical predicted protein [Pelobates cultripes]